MKTLVVSLWAGPGTGKSTNAALVFGKLKAAGVEAELVHEYAKDLTWEERHMAMANQTYIAAKQQHHVERVLGKVEVAITDAPLPFSIIYAGKGYTEHLGAHILEVYRDWDTFNFFLERNEIAHPYVEAGRHQTLKEARDIDWKIRRFMARHGFLDRILRIGEGENTADLIFGQVLGKLDARRQVG